MVKMNNKRWFFLTEIILAILVVLCISFMLQGENKKKNKEIAVIVQNSGGEQWNGFKYGIKMAAQDENVKTSIISTGDNLSMEEEKKLIQQEIDAGADAVIVQPPSGSGAYKMLKEFEYKIPVMLVEGSVPNESKDEVLPVTAPDNYNMGRALAEEIVKDYNVGPSGYKLGIYASKPKNQTTIDRIKGIEDGLEGYQGEISWVILDNSEKNLLKDQKRVNIIVAMDDESVVTAAEAAKADELHGASIYGIGTSMKSLYYMDEDFVKSLVIPDEFNVGYQSLTSVSKKLSHYFTPMKSGQVSYKTIRKDTLFTEENQKLLFVLNQ